MKVKGNLCQDSMSWLKFEQGSIRVQVQRSTLSYVTGNLKIPKGQLNVKGILTTISEPSFLVVYFYIFILIVFINVLWVILHELQVFCS